MGIVDIIIMNFALGWFRKENSTVRYSTVQQSSERKINQSTKEQKIIPAFLQFF